MKFRVRIQLACNSRSVDAGLYVYTGVTPNTLVGELNSCIETLLGIPKDNQVIIIESPNGQKLQPVLHPLEHRRSAISCFGVEKPGFTLHVHESTPPIQLRICIRIQPHQTETLSFKFCPSDPILALKVEIEKKARNKIPPAIQSLKIEGKVTKDDNPLSRYCSQRNKSVDVEVTIKKVTTFKIYVDTYCKGGQQLELQVKSCSTIRDIKKRIYAAKGIPVEKQSLKIGDKELDDDKMLAQYQIFKTKTLQFAVKPLDSEISPEAEETTEECSGSSIPLADAILDQNSLETECSSSSVTRTGTFHQYPCTAELDDSDINEVSKYLSKIADKAHLVNLGVVMGLSYCRLKSDQHLRTFTNDLIYSWILKQDYVLNKGLLPTWSNLIVALKDERVGQTGLATAIARDKKIHI